MTDETVTQALHRLTSYEPGREWTEPIADPRIVQELEVNDVDRYPWPYKRYEQNLARLELPTELPTTSVSALAVLAGTARPGPVELDLAQLARMLFFSAGVVRVAEREGGPPVPLPRGGLGRSPTSHSRSTSRCPRRQPLADVHWFHPPDHTLVPDWPAAGR